MNHHVALVAGLALLTSAASAADQDIYDLRGYYGIPPDYEVTDSGRDDIDGGHRLGVQHMRNFTEIGDVGGWIWGAEASLSFVDDQGVEAFIPAITGLVGYAYQLQNLENLHFEGTPYLGVGLASIDGTGDDSELYLEYGLRVASFWTFESNWQAGIDLRLHRADADVIDSSGLLACFVGGYRF
ncbi:MAG TPA: hypothetical protein VEL07_13775 [Planctomycetota bacterium]|nr:hypothetical protein [Planctomycetota bacterium]